MLAWLCSMLNTASKMWIAAVRSSEIFTCSRSLRIRHVLCWIKAAALHVPCPALLSISLCLILCIFMQFLTRRTTESSNLVWTPSSGSSAKIAGELFHPVHHLFSKGEGKQLFEQGAEPDSWTPRCAASQALLAAAWARPSPCLRQDTQLQSDISTLQALKFMCYLLHCAHQLVSGSGFSQRPWESQLYVCLHVLALDQVWGLQCLGMPGYASLLLSTSFFSPLRHSCYLVKWFLCHFCSNPAQLELFRPPWRQISCWPRHLPISICWIPVGSGLRTVTLGLVSRTSNPCLQVYADAVLRSIVFSWSVFLLITHLYESVLALCQSWCQCELNCQGLYIYFSDENL